ncbi:MAG: hypothetical protein KAJ58_00250 [Candidatus Pacebacteria bacterium]|nr:hypothetical protein [Candidatus Paceibacterota bacterium]
MDDAAKSILFILLGLGLFWFITGGLNRMEEGMFITPPTFEKPSEVYGEVPSFWDFLKRPASEQNLSPEEKLQLEIEQAKKEADQIEYDLEKIKELEDTSIYKNKIEISRSYGSRSNVNEEYIKLKVNNLGGEKLQISDWTLKSKMTGQEISLGKVVKLPYTSQNNYLQTLFVSGGEEIIVMSGRSPIGFSFQINKCSGYLEQFQDFEPRISKNCPLIEDENLPIIGPNAFNDACLDFIDDISRCETPLNYPLDMQGECRNYLITNANHNTCITNYKNDSNFYKAEWRIFLNRTQELWKKDREIIELRDNQGKLVDSYSY